MSNGRPKAAFPCSVSLLYGMENGASAIIAVTGNEGLVGISLFVGGEITRRAGVKSGSSLQHFLPCFTQAQISPDGAERSVQPASFGLAAVVAGRLMTRSRRTDKKQTEEQVMEAR